ncbi:hypothetical protein CCMA1212_010267 [Trichoderma ghanense]|uniref:Uncharacterized protein n=1 Tax=Trichoderma ghanense TaxID=65468 RepID=A0ABY2GRH4_9HYPO
MESSLFCCGLGFDISLIQLVSCSRETAQDKLQTELLLFSVLLQPLRTSRHTTWADITRTRTLQPPL